MTDSIRVCGLRFAYPPLSTGSAAPWVIDGLDLRAEAGEWLAIMGATDSGKTTLCLLLAGLAPHLTGGTLEGEVRIDGQAAPLGPPPATADTVGILFQEAEAQLFNPTVEAEVAWGLENLGLPVAEIRARTDWALSRLRLEAVRDRSPHELSGGEKKRLALASVLAMRPRLLVLDEPLGGLDPVGRAEVLAALGELRHDSGVTIVMAESDPDAVAAFADRVAILHEGRIAHEAGPRSLFQQPEVLARTGVAIPQLAHLAASLNRRLGSRYDFLTVDEARQSLSPALGRASRPGGGAPSPAAAAVREEEVSLAAPSAPDRPQEPEPILPARPEASGGGSEGTPRPSLELSGVWFWYGDARRPVLRDVSLRIASGEFVALVGANGSGKTTLIKHFNGLLRPRRGQVKVFGEETSGRSIGQLARQVGYLFQHPEQQIFSATVREEVAFGPRNLGLPPDEVRERTDAALVRFGLEQVAESPPAILSYGLRRSVTLASLAAMDPAIIVLDEPTVGLDAWGLRQTFGWLQELHGKGRTIVLVTHDMALIAEYADRAIVLHQGEVLADLPPFELFRQPRLMAQASLARPPLIGLAEELRPLGFRAECATVEAFCDELIALIPGQGARLEPARSPAPDTECQP